MSMVLVSNKTSELFALVRERMAPSFPRCKNSQRSIKYTILKSQQFWFNMISLSDIRGELIIQKNNIAWNPDLQKLYIEIQQTCTFRILPIPGRSVPVKFVTVIDVQKGRHQRIQMRNTSVEVDDVMEPEDGDDLWYIKKQNDLYQTDQWFNFLVPGGTYVIYPIL